MNEKISKEWTAEERLQVIAKLAKKCRSASTRTKDQFAETIVMVSTMLPMFLESNREMILEDAK